MDGRELADLFYYFSEKWNVSRKDQAQAVSLIFQRIVGDPECLPPPANTNKAAQIVKEVNPSKVLMSKGDSCICTQCKKVAYGVVGTVYAEGMSGEEFLACFNPEPKAPIDLLMDEYGNQCVDCPLCGSNKTVVLIRRDNAVK